MDTITHFIVILARFLMFSAHDEISVCRFSWALCQDAYHFINLYVCFAVSTFVVQQPCLYSIETFITRLDFGQEKVFTLSLKDLEEESCCCIQQ